MYGVLRRECYVEQVTPDKRFLQGELIILIMSGVSVQCTNTSIKKKIAIRKYLCEVVYSGV